MPIAALTPGLIVAHGLLAVVTPVLALLAAAGGS
jgi:hypothetical protein